MSALLAPIARLYKLLPESVRYRVRPLRRPAWSMFGYALWRATRGETYIGPFKGLQHGSRPQRSTLVGTFERELHDWLEQLFAQPFDTVVNVGGGAGYYAAGIARRLPHATMTVFESNPAARAVVDDTLRLNGIAGRVTVLGECTLETLSRALSGRSRTLVVMDVEGAEKTLLDPDAIPALRRATILVETHDVFVPGTHDAIRSRFAATHAIDERTIVPRTMADYPDELLPLLRRLMRRSALNSINEWRQPPSAWLLLVPRP